MYLIYSEDYIRYIFKNKTGFSPLDFLTKLRIEHAQKLLDIYGDNISVAEVAEACGFDDSVYFSRRFKQFTSLSPTQYKNGNCKS